MKIDRSFYTAKRNQSHEGAAETGSTRNRRFLRREETGSDRVEISPQAKERYETGQRAKDTARAVTDYIRTVLYRSTDSSERQARIRMLKEEVQSSRYNFDEPGHLAGAAERLSDLFQKGAEKL